MLKRHSDDDLSRDPFDWTLGDPRESGSTTFTSMRKILGPRELPEADALAETELIGLLNELEFELLQHRIQVDFLDSLPARVAYRGILQMLDTPVELGSSPFQIQHIDGCDSACESCFQLAHCAVAREILGTEWRLAVEQAGINPSWSALFASEDEE
jgi:hypothetical protein